jgi:hypothetical protein
MTASPAYRITRKLAPIDAAYIAGLVDGEGTISLLRRHRGDERQLVVSISSTERVLLEHVLAAVGVGKITRKRTYSVRHAPGLTYSVSNRQALALLEQLAPHLRSYKAERARLLISGYVRLTPRNGRYTPALRAAREAFVARVLATKAR